MSKKFNPKIADEGRRLMGSFVRDRRKEIGWSQDQLANCAGLRRATIADMEAGRGYGMNSLLAVLGCMRGKLSIEWQEMDGKID